MQKFIDKHRQDILGVLSGFDRIRFRGTIRMWAYVNGLLGWLCDRKVLLKNFTDFAQGMTATIKESLHSVAKPAVQWRSGQRLKKSTAVVSTRLLKIAALYDPPRFPMSRTTCRPWA